MNSIKKMMRAAAVCLCAVCLLNACTASLDEVTLNGGTPLGTTNIRIADFPAFNSEDTQGADTRSGATGNYDAGKSAWVDGDEILLKIKDVEGKVTTASLTYSINDGQAAWAVSGGSITIYTGTANIEAYYAPAYQWSDSNTLILKDGKTAGVDEYLTYQANDVDLTDKNNNIVNIDFSNGRKYSRLRVAATGLTGKTVTLACTTFTPAGAATALGENATISTTIDDKENAYFYGTWTANAKLDVSVNGSPSMSKTIAYASTTGKSYAWESPFMQFRFTVAMSDNSSFSIPFPTSGTTPAEIKVSWGDGETVTVASGTALSSSDAFVHTYTTAGDYTITITSDQADKSKKQIPDFNFNNNRAGSSNKSYLKSIDTPLLNTGATSLENCFRDCSKLTSIPQGLFDNNTTATTFLLCFYGCSNLTEIPKGLFDNNTAATTFENCFRGCSNLTSIPQGLFDNNTIATTFFLCFFGCSNLTEIPKGLFDNNTVVTNFISCFYGCSKLTSIPQGLFDNNTDATTFANCFRGCSNLTEIPQGLFAKNAAATTFSYCFNNCTKLKLNADIFIDDTNTKETRFANVSSINFKYCFYNCGTDESVATGEGGIAPDLWNYTYKAGVTPTKTNCFYAVNKVTNLGDIPDDWD